ncbi:MAG: YkvA family protein [Caldimonas sp.]
MWKRLTLLWSLVRGDAARLWFALRHPAAPGWLKVGTALIVLYVVSPIDLVPDVLPVLGIVDDLVVVPLAIRFLLDRLPREIVEAAARRGAVARSPMRR